MYKQQQKWSDCLRDLDLLLQIEPTDALKREIKETFTLHTDQKKGRRKRRGKIWRLSTLSTKRWPEVISRQGSWTSSGSTLTRRKTPMRELRKSTRIQRKRKNELSKPSKTHFKSRSDNGKLKLLPNKLYKLRKRRRRSIQKLLTQKKLKAQLI